MYTIEVLNALSLAELKQIAEKRNMQYQPKLDKQALIHRIMDQEAMAPNPVPQKMPLPTTLTKNKTALKPLPVVQVHNPERKKNKIPLPHQQNNKASANHSSKNENSANWSKSNKKNPGNHKGKRSFIGFEGIIQAEGVLELIPDGYGLLRSSYYNYLSSPDDVYVSHNLIKRWGLKTGDTLAGKLSPPRESEKYFRLWQLETINGKSPEQIKSRVSFECLTPLFPQEKLNIINSPTQRTTRILDLFAPVGKGQRGMIVAQPKAGKTILLKDIANGIAKNHPEAYLIVLLIDERPEEVTDMMRDVNAEVIASTFDQQATQHVKVADIVLEKAKRLVESEYDVIILLDSLTRLARAHNTTIKSSGKILSGGVDANALNKPKRFFGAARNVENGGSLTILATALIETGSRMDEVIFEEFKGTGNMELQLDRKLANRGIYPAIDMTKSSTRKADLLQNKETIDRINTLRHKMIDMRPDEALDFLIQNMKGTKDNAMFLASMY